VPSRTRTAQFLVPRAAASARLAAVPALFAPTTPETTRRFIEYFAANIRNANTRRAYLLAVRSFVAWCAAQHLHDLVDIEPIHVAGYIEQLSARLAKSSTKQHLAALRMLFDWLVVGQVIKVNPAAPVRGPRYTVKKGKAPILTQAEARCLLDAIAASTLRDLRDRAVIATMIYTFGRIAENAR
jgi:site-specific recombinase XerD